MKHKRYDYLVKLYKWNKNGHKFTYIDELNIHDGRNWRKIFPYMDGFVMFISTPGGAGPDYFFIWDGVSLTNLDTNTIPFNSIKAAITFGNKLHIFGTIADDREARHHYIWDGSLWMEIPNDRTPFDDIHAKYIICDNSIYVWLEFDHEAWKWDGISWTKMGKYVFTTLWRSIRGKRRWGWYMGTCGKI